jgi:hypothetical protein
MTLHDAIDKDHFIIDENQYTDFDLQEMPLDELESLKMRINKKISGISASIKGSQIDFANTGKRAPRDWYMNNKLSLSINQRVLVYINILIKKRRRSERSISDFFMDSAKSILSTQDFNFILNNAHDKMGAVEGKL